jgi:hypothetical protein
MFIESSRGECVLVGFDHPSEDSYGTYSSSKSSAKNSKDVSNIIDDVRQKENADENIYCLRFSITFVIHTTVITDIHRIFRFIIFLEAWDMAGHLCIHIWRSYLHFPNRLFTLHYDLTLTFFLRIFTFSHNHPRNSEIDQGDLFEFVSQCITAVLFLKLIPQLKPYFLLEKN